MSRDELERPEFLTLADVSYRLHWRDALAVIGITVTVLLFDQGLPILAGACLIGMLFAVAGANTLAVANSNPTPAQVLYDDPVGRQLLESGSQLMARRQMLLKQYSRLQVASPRARNGAFVADQASMLKLWEANWEVQYKSERGMYQDQQQILARLAPSTRAFTSRLQ